MPTSPSGRKTHDAGIWKWWPSVKPWPRRLPRLRLRCRCRIKNCMRWQRTRRSTRSNAKRTGRRWRKAGALMQFRRRVAREPPRESVRDKGMKRAAAAKSLKHSSATGQEVPVEWDLRLYIAGRSPKCVAAFTNLQKLCEEHLAGQYRIEVIDWLKNKQLAEGDQILAIPTLVRKLPEPIKKIIGDLSNTERVLVGLDLRPRT